MARPDRPRALFCTSDEIALRALRAAAEAGLSVPDELAIVGFDDIVEARASHPPLTTVRQPVGDIASAAVETLLALRDDGGPQPDRWFPVTLQVRGTCGCPSP